MSQLQDLPKDYVAIGFSTPINPGVIKGTISWAIRAEEKTPYSHVYVKTRLNGLERTIVYHASHDSLHFMNYDVFKSQNHIFDEFVFYVTPEKKKKVLQFCIDTAARSYGHLELCGIAMVKLVKAWFGKKIKNPYRDGDQTMVCDELGGRCMEIMDLMGPGFDSKILEDVGPRWLHDKCIDLLQSQACQRVVFFNAV